MLSFLLSIADASNHGKITYLYNNYHDDMMRLAKDRLKNHGCDNYEIDAEDVVQGSFLNILKYIDSVNFDLPKKELRSYVLTIVLNESGKLAKEYEKFDFTEGPETNCSDEDFFEKLEIKEKYLLVMSLIKRMDEKYGITLLYYYHEDMSVKNISKIMGISSKTVYKRLERGKLMLLEMLEGRVE
ncbi:MAG: RNA polymerase sigma factor [Clostridia bacterium]|nr:RNA polymerase sigma factor [Clostridia bacterium]